MAAPEAVLSSVGLVDAWLLECGDLLPHQVTQTLSCYRGLQNGQVQADEVQNLLADQGKDGWFTGHPHQGSRALDAVQAQVQTAD